MFQHNDFSSRHIAVIFFLAAMANGPDCLAQSDEEPDDFKGFVCGGFHDACYVCDGAYNTDWRLPVEAEPDSKTAHAARELLDRVVQFDLIETTVLELGDKLEETFPEVAFFVDERALKFAEVDADQVVTIKATELAVRAVLRKILEPLGLKAQVVDEGILVTADLLAMARREIGTVTRINAGDGDRRFEQALESRHSVEYSDTPLSDVATDLQEKFGVPILIDRRAMEDIGLSDEAPVTLQIENVTLRSILGHALRDLEMTYIVRNEALMLTTHEASGENQTGRIYWLTGIGIFTEDAQSIIAMIQTNIAPDTWESLGGPSTLIDIQGGGGRVGIVIRTSDHIHHEIELLFRGMRETHFGPDPRFKSEN